MQKFWLFMALLVMFACKGQTKSIIHENISRKIIKKNEMQVPPISAFDGENKLQLQLEKIERVDIEFLQKYNPIEVSVFDYLDLQTLFFKLVSKSEAKLEMAAKASFAEIQFCQLLAEKCQWQESIEFSGAFYHYLGYNPKIHAYRTRICLRHDRAKTEQKECSPWKQEQKPTEFAPKTIISEQSKNLLHLFENLSAERERLRSQCPILYAAYRDYINKTQDKVSQHYLLAANSLSLGIDHCYQLLESDFAEHIILGMKALVATEQEKISLALAGKEGEDCKTNEQTDGDSFVERDHRLNRNLHLSGEEKNSCSGYKEKKIGKLSYDVLYGILIALSSASIAKTAGTYAMNYIDNNPSRFNRYGISANFSQTTKLRANRAGVFLLLAEAAFAGLYVLDTLLRSDKIEAETFPWITSAVMIFATYELFEIAKHNPPKSLQKYFADKFKNGPFFNTTQVRTRPSTSQTNSPKISDANGKNKTSFDPSHKLHKPHFVMLGIGAILGALEIANIETEGKVEKFFTGNHLTSQSTFEKNENIKAAIKAFIERVRYHRDRISHIKNQIKEQFGFSL